MLATMYIYCYKLHDAHNNVAASKHLAGLAVASDSACRTLDDQAALYDDEIVMYHNKLSEKLP